MANDETTGPATIDCTAVRRGDVLERYIRGELDAPRMEAFEAHYLACDDCWRALETAVEARAAFAGADRTAPPRTRGDAGDDPAAAAAGGGLERQRPRRRAAVAAAGLAAAAALAFVLFGVGLDGGDATDGAAGGGEVWRGGVAALEIRLHVGDGAVTAAWSPPAGAEIYRVRAFSPDGRLIQELESRDTVLGLDAERLAADGDTTVYVSVEAFDELRTPVARADPRPVRLPTPGPRAPEPRTR